MKHFYLLVIAILAVPFSVFAQEVPPAPAAPVIAGSAPLSSYFPILPPSRACEARDLRGFWKLRQVYQNPVGEQLQAFATQPYQYLLFKNNSVYKESRSAYQQQDGAIFKQLKNGADNPLLQYVLGQNGALFFYSNQVAVDTKMCFVVANRQDPFLVGEILLMPPLDKAANGRLVSVYEAISPNGKPVLHSNRAPVGVRVTQGVGNR